MYSLLFGMQRDVIIRPNGKEDTAVSIFDNIRLHLPSPLHIYEALDNVFDVQNKDLDGGTVQGHISIEARPPVLGLQIQRGGWDATKQDSYKIEHHLQLEEVIYLDRYLFTDDPRLKEMKQQKWQWKKEKAALEAERAALAGPYDGMDAPTMISETARYITHLQAIKEEEEEDLEAPSIKENLPTSLKQKAAELDHALAKITQKLEELSRKMEAQFAGFKSVPYRLYALCIHKGGMGFGHYWLYIHDFANGIWRKYNDDKIDIIDNPKITIFQEPTGSRPPTPNYVIYIQDDIKEKIVEPLCRHPNSVASEEIEMKDV